MTTMTYGQLVEAYVAVREERDRLRADDLAIRQLLRDHGVSVGDVDPLPAVVAETLDGVRKVNTALADLRYGLANALEMVDIPDDDAIIRTVARLRAALGTTPDTGSTTP